MWKPADNSIVFVVVLILFHGSIKLVHAQAFEENCTTDGDIRLYNGTTSNEGAVQICTTEGVWSAVCDYSWDCADAKVACNQLGYSNSVTAPRVFLDSHFGTWQTINFEYFQCTASAAKLIDCLSYSYSCNTKNLAGLRCINYQTDCTENEIRLTGSGNKSSSSVDEGKVEMCINSMWTPVCASHTGDEEAAVICKELGHTEYPWAAVYTEGYGTSPVAKQYVRPACQYDYSESKLSDCSKALVDNQCSTSAYCEIGRIKCFDPGDCDEGAVRLVDGDIEQEGRIEICTNGVWGVLCGTSFGITDAYVVCKQLGKGITSKGPLAYTSSQYGAGQYPIVMSNIGCEGWEQSLTDCSHIKYGTLTCSRTTVAGALCYDDCEDGDVRLISGALDSSSDNIAEGTVEVCLGGLWGMIGESGWSTHDGLVVCKQLGFSTQGVKVFNNSHYGKSKRPVNINNVACIGNENKLLDCKHYEFSETNKKSLRSLIDVVGVKCTGAGSATGATPTTTTTTTTSTTTTVSANDSGDTSAAASLSIMSIILVLLIVVFLALFFTQIYLFIVLRKSVTHVISAITTSEKNLKSINNQAYEIPSTENKKMQPPLPARNNTYNDIPTANITEDYYSEMT